MASSSIPLTDRQRAMPAARPVIKAKSATTAAVLLPVALLLYSTLLPQEVRISISGQVIFPYRAVTFLVLPWLIKQIFTGKMPFRPADLWVYGGVAWMMISLIVFYGIGDGISRGGALALDTIAPYVIARICIRSVDDLRRLLIIFAPGLFLAGLSMMFESITHVPIVRPLAAKIFGSLSYFENGQAVAAAKDFSVVRLGLLRAAGPFSHPILAGVFVASFLPLYLNSSLRKWPYKLGVAAGVMAIFSVSSAAFLAFFIMAVLLGYEFFQRRVNGIGWRFFVFCMVALIFLVENGSQSGVIPILIRYTLDPQTGYFRQLIWEYGLISIGNYPWFGIGFTDYARLPWMINSIDGHWLLLGVRHGFLVPLLFLIPCVTAIFELALASNSVGRDDKKLLFGINIALIIMVISAFTVTYFGASIIWFMALIGVSYSVSSQKS